MTISDEPRSRKQRVQDAVIRFLNSDKYGNSCRYFQAGDIADLDAELTSSMVGSYLPVLEDESPFASGITVAKHTERNNSTVWVVRRESASSQLAGGE
ncbi:hypothetical protein [Halococcus thailandensis]|uniref:hypothetical protein n=1 Tax=Halococcus thailandensis TaxID=335952 RepID=UPI000677AB0B|nr:hypothetical protein [Halococcus thailandensis]